MKRWKTFGLLFLFALAIALCVVFDNRPNHFKQPFIEQATSTTLQYTGQSLPFSYPREIQPQK